MDKDIVIKDNEYLGNPGDCKHIFKHQADVNIKGIIYDIYYCSNCLIHVKKERPCPCNLKEEEQ